MPHILHPRKQSTWPPAGPYPSRCVKPSPLSGVEQLRALVTGSQWCALREMLPDEVIASPAFPPACAHVAEEYARRFLEIVTGDHPFTVVEMREIILDHTSSVQPTA